MLKEGELILLYRDDRRNFLTHLTRERFHTDKGFIEMEPLIGAEYGLTVTTNLGYDFYVLKPTLYQLMMKVKRLTQIVYPKDAALIINKSTISSGSHVIESGIGSGALTTAFAHTIGPQGKIYAYERSEMFLKNAKKNLEKNGLADRVEFKQREITPEVRFDERDVDFVMIDVGSPWELLDAAYEALKPGCRMATICPNFEQVTETVFTMEDKGFINIETFEVLTRRILVRRGKTRPEQRIPSHTGFVILGTKITTSPPHLSPIENPKP